jgi:hypothetical protein
MSEHINQIAEILEHASPVVSHGRAPTQSA